MLAPLDRPDGIARLRGRALGDHPLLPCLCPVSTVVNIFLCLPLVVILPIQQRWIFFSCVLPNSDDHCQRMPDFRLKPAIVI